MYSILTAYRRSHIFITGGLKNGVLATVEVYSVDRDQWRPCANLNIGRKFHSSCILGEKIYVSGGDLEDSIEVADCFKLINGSAKW